MEQYLITAFDFTDEKALERRLAVRDKHLAGARKMRANNNLVIAGAMLNKEGKMIGSSMIVQFGSRQEVDVWLDNEPYILEKVWEKVDVKPFKVAAV